MKAKATSIIFLANVANFSRGVFSLADAKTIRTLVGNSYMNSSLMCEPSVVIAF